MNTPVTSICLHPNQATLVVADQSGTIYLWDLSTDHNEQHVSYLLHAANNLCVFVLHHACENYEVERQRHNKQMYNYTNFYV